jgi:hypothetical protein
MARETKDLVATGLAVKHNADTSDCIRKNPAHLEYEPGYRVTTLDQFTPEPAERCNNLGCWLSPRE